MMSSSNWVIVTLPSRKIISVVTSPVMSDTPPEFTANTTSTAKRMVWLNGNPSDSTMAMDTRVAVMLSAREEKQKLKMAVKKISFRSVILAGMMILSIFSIMPLRLR